ncbi:MAG: phosphotriesterase-related protein [Proteobacteria bacterium]|nr:phosphotriesterase-related protein [Pseudomonadota bacterium]
MSGATVNTVMGAVEAKDLGRTLMHEHIVFGYPGWYGDLSVAPYDREAALEAGLELMDRVKEYGVNALVDATPNDCGRDVELLREISERTGVHIICSTGYYHEGEGAPVYFKIRNKVGDAVAEIHELFVKEITEGIGGTGIKAGVIKVASGKNVITDYDKLFFKAAARAQQDTGVPIITHTQAGTMGPEQARLLISEGADPGRIMIGHMSDSTDIRYHVRVLNEGVFVGIDRLGLQYIVGCPWDVERYAVIIGLVGIGYADRLMFSHDWVAYWMGRETPMSEAAVPLLGNWYPTHLFKNVIPALKKGGVSEAQIKTMIEGNPRRLFEGGPA